MTYNMTESQQELREMAREFGEKYIAPIAVEMDRKPSEFPREMFKKMAEASFLTFPIMKEYGGLGKSKVGYVTLIEEMDCFGALPFLLKTGDDFAPIGAFRLEEQKKYLPEIQFTDIPFMDDIRSLVVNTDCDFARRSSFWDSGPAKSLRSEREKVRNASFGGWSSHDPESYFDPMLQLKKYQTATPLTDYSNKSLDLSFRLNELFECNFEAEQSYHFDAKDRSFHMVCSAQFHLIPSTSRNWYTFYWIFSESQLVYFDSEYGIGYLKDKFPDEGISKTHFSKDRSSHLQNKKSFSLRC